LAARQWQAVVAGIAEEGMSSFEKKDDGLWAVLSGASL